MRDGLDLDAIRVFVAVARAGSVSSGAREVGLTRSAGGKALARLEARLGVRLLHRTTRRLGLTADGQGFYERCRQILADLEEAETGIRRDGPEPKGVLRLTLSSAFGRRRVLPILAAYLESWPELAAEVSLTDRIADLVEEGYDLAVRCGGRPTDTRLIARVIARSPVLLCASPGYLAARGEPRSAADLPRHSRLTLGERGEGRPWRITPPGEETLCLTDPGRLRLNSGEALRDAALAGLGLAYLPSFLVDDDVAMGALRVLLPDHGTEEIVARALYPSRRHLSGKVRLLVDRLADALGSP